MRSALAWMLYGLGHAWFVVFDRISPLGMPGPIYDVYHGLMSASTWAQGEGPGPWSRAA
jgi:hypothetical protein